LYSFGMTLQYLLLDWTRFHAFQAALRFEERAQLLAIGLWCTQPEPTKRPSLTKVYQELGRVVGGLQLSVELAVFNARAEESAEMLIQKADLELELAKQQTAAKWANLLVAQKKKQQQQQQDAEDWASYDLQIALRPLSSDSSSSMTKSSFGSLPREEVEAEIAATSSSSSKGRERLLSERESKVWTPHRCWGTGV
jgi:hypothetical protein